MHLSVSFGFFCNIQLNELFRQTKTWSPCSQVCPSPLCPSYIFVWCLEIHSLSTSIFPRKNQLLVLDRRGTQERGTCRGHNHSSGGPSTSFLLQHLSQSTQAAKSGYNRPRADEERKFTSHGSGGQVLVRPLTSCVLTWQRTDAVL